jgi:hypothetical protein
MDGTCTAGAQYKYCRYSGAIGVFFVESSSLLETDAGDRDRMIQIRLTDDDWRNNQLVPAVFIAGFGSTTKNALDMSAAAQATRGLRIIIGPDVGGEDAGVSDHVETGGLRVVDMYSGRMIKHHTGNDFFGSVNFVEPSEVRNIIFVCTDPDVDDNVTSTQIAGIFNGTGDNTQYYSMATATKTIRVFDT